MSNIVDEIRKQITALPMQTNVIGGQHFKYVKVEDVLSILDNAETPYVKLAKEIVIELISGLTIDGASQKQHFLEQAFRKFTSDGYVEMAKDEFRWKDGAS